MISDATPDLPSRERMTDIVERLRGKPVRYDYFPEADRQEAADEIERLRADKELTAIRGSLHAEIARLRKALLKARWHLRRYNQPDALALIEAALEKCYGRPLLPLEGT